MRKIILKLFNCFNKNSRILVSIIISFVIALFASCTSTDFKAERKTIELKGNPTTGYSWFYEIEDDSVISIEEDVKYLGAKGMVGAPSLFTYTVIARKSGSTKITFEYKRPWETQPALETKVYEVSVDDQGRLVISE